MEQVTFGLGGGHGASGGHGIDPAQAYISNLLASANGHGSGHDSFSSHDSGGGHAAQKPNPLVQLAVLALGGVAAWKLGLSRMLGKSKFFSTLGRVHKQFGLKGTLEFIRRKLGFLGSSKVAKTVADGVKAAT